MTTIVSRAFLGATFFSADSLMTFLQLQLLQWKTELSLVRFKTILFPHERQNSIATLP